MSLQKALEEELSSITGFTNKVFPIIAQPDEAIITPYILYEAGYGKEVKVLTGYSNLRSVDCELNIITNTYASLRTNVDLVMAKLKSFERRTIGNDATIFIQEVTYNSPVEIYEQLPKLYRCVVEFKLHY